MNIGFVPFMLWIWVDELYAPAWIVDLHVIQEVYVIPFYSKPMAHTRTNQQSTWVNTGFVDLAVAELLSGGYVQTVSARPYICSLLSEEALGA